jgi:hypothetical protein
VQHQNRTREKKKKGAKVINFQQKIRLAKIQLQRDPENEPAREILSTAQGHLADSLQEKVAKNHQLSATSWFRYGDTCSKHFFDFHRIRRKCTPLKELKTEGGDIMGEEDLAHYVRTYYKRLYTSEANALGTSEAREECWGSTPTQVSNEANDNLTKDVAPLLWPSVGVNPNTWKSWDLESSGTPEYSELDGKGQNTLHWGVLGVVGTVLKRQYRKCPRIGNSDICSPSYGQKKGRESNWQFDSRPLKVKN